MLASGLAEQRRQSVAGEVPRSVDMGADAVTIEWSDGQVCKYPYRALRLNCACAACIEEMTGRKLLNAAAIPADIIAVDHMQVGRYALQFLWSDGHTTGIYPFAMLRRLCESQ